MQLSTLSLRLSVSVIWTCAMLIAKPAAPAAGSLSDLDIEYSELKVALRNMLDENEQLRRTIIDSKKAMVAMRQSVSATDNESEILKLQVKQMKLRLDALGFDSTGGGNAKLEQRLLTAVSDLRLASAEKKKLSEALIRLTEATAYFAKTATAADPQSRLSLETEIRNANVALGMTPTNTADAGSAVSTVTDGQVISLKEDLELVVMNLGDTQGVKVGMPFQVVRGDKVIGSIRAVDVREKIAGAVIQNLSSDKEHIKVGDQLRVAAQQ